MLQTIYYDMSRFKSEQGAIDAKEVYRVRIMGKTLIVTDPSGEEHPFELKVPKRGALHTVDRKPLVAWLGLQMATREDETKTNKNVTKKVQEAGKKTSTK